MGFKIAIDGPAGAGKSTIAKIVAKKLDFLYVDTGAMYRAIALYLLENHVAPEDSEKIGERCREAAVALEYQNGEQIVLLNGVNVNSKIRTEAVGNMASASSAHEAVRAQLLEMQRRMGSLHDVVMDGRDIGTNVLPDAELKIYLTADAHVRALRRYKELTGKGEKPDLDKIEQDILTRDKQDMTRELAPLRQADDAVLLDSSDLSIQEVAQKILQLCQKKAGGRNQA